MIIRAIAVSHRPVLIRHWCDELRRVNVTDASNNLSGELVTGMTKADEEV